MYVFARQSRSDSLGVGIPKTKCVCAQSMAQPIYAISKQIEWKWTDTFGENKFVLMLGARVLTPGRAEAVSPPTPDHHLKRMRYVVH